MRIHQRVFVFALSAGMVMGVIRGYSVFLALLLLLILIVGLLYGRKTWLDKI